MVTSEEITKKFEEMMEKISKDNEHAQQHIENLMSYLEGLGDFAVHESDKNAILSLTVFFRLLKGMIKIKKETEAKFSNVTSDLNNALSRIKRLEDEFAEMKKGK